MATTDKECAYISSETVTYARHYEQGPLFVNQTSGDLLYYCCPDPNGNLPICTEFPLNDKKNSSKERKTSSKSTSSTKQQINKKIPGFNECMSKIKGSPERAIKICCDNVDGNYVQESTGGVCYKSK